MVKKKRQTDVHDDGSTDSSEDKLNSSFSSSSDVCHHVKRAVDPTKLRKVLKVNGLLTNCGQCKKSNNDMTEMSTAGSGSVENGLIDDEDLSGFEYDNTLWLCLKCGTQLCGRSKNQHALQHFKTPHSDSHSLTMNTGTHTIWCYECDNEINASSRKNLLECVELVKKLSHKTASSPKLPVADNENDVAGDERTWENVVPLLSNNDNACNNILNKVVPLPPPPQPQPPIPGMAKRVNEPKTNAVTTGTNSHSIYGPLAMSNIPVMTGTFGPATQIFQSPDLENLPRVRGLTNLGNTCFFNAVLQCLARTPYLLDVLKESAEPGEEFILPGGTFKFKDGEDMELPMIKGKLSSWGNLTAALTNTLEALQSSGGVFTPSKLFDKLCAKCPQFCGGDQHDSHELLRHLLESVRSEDLKRYQRVILQNLGYKDQDVSKVSEELKQKCKIYGNQAADRILRPDQVFRGFLVSTLTCQDCFNTSSRHEYFLDISLPVNTDNPPERRINAPPGSFYLNPAPSAPPQQTKAQIKKEKEKERKAKRAAKHANNKLAQKLLLEDVTSATVDTKKAASAVGSITSGGTSTPSRNDASVASGSGSSEQSDADVEDNLIDDQVANTNIRPKNVGPALPSMPLLDSNGNNQLPSPVKPEKRDDTPENMDKDSLDEEENDSGIATSPANAETNGCGTTSSSDANSLSTANNSILAVGLSEKGVNWVRQLSLGDGNIQDSATKNAKTTSVEATCENDPSGSNSASSVTLTNGPCTSPGQVTQAAAQLEDLQLNNEKETRKRSKRVRTQSHSDWCTTIAPRYECEDGECSVQSCLNNFTGVEMMSGNNKVGCENCTKNINGDDPKAKTVNTDATKQFLISSPPAVLILHLKRFQLGPRGMFRKLTRPVSYPMILDIAPFCGSKVKNLPNIDRKQKKLIYSLYGVVEHSGSMYGGHYTAYVKVRPDIAPDDKRWKFIPQGSKAELEQDDEQRKKLDELLAKEKARELRMKATNDSDDFSTSSTSSSDAEIDTPLSPDTEMGAVGGDEEARNVQVPIGKWYYVSDARVHEVTEDAVLTSQAYILFYERIY